MIIADDVVEPPQPLSVQAAACQKPVAAIAFRADRPEFIRLPKPGKRCHWTGLARSAVNDLILGPDPPVKSVVVARKGASRGIRLVHLGSLLGYLNGLMSHQDTGKEVSDD